MKNLELRIRAIEIHNNDCITTGILFESLDQLETFLQIYTEKCRAYRKGMRLVMAWDHPTCKNIQGVVNSEFAIGFDPCSCPDIKNFHAGLDICERIISIRMNDMVRRLNRLHFEQNH